MFVRSCVAPALAALAITVAASSATAAGLKFEHVMNIGSEGLAPGQFKYVEDMAFSKGGHLLVTDASHAFVQMFDKRTGQFLARFGGRGDDDGNLEKPEGIAVAADGSVFIADYATGFVKKYGPDFKWLMTFSEYGSAPGQTMKSEFMDIRGDRLFLPDAGNHRINVFDLAGRALLQFGGPGAVQGQFNTPEAAKFDSAGRLFVSDLRNDRIQMFDADGHWLATIGRPGTGPGELKSPAGLAFDRDDNLYVTEIGNNRIQVFDKAGKFLAMFGAKGTADGEFANLHGIIVDKTTGLVYVADTGNSRIQVFKVTKTTDAAALGR